MQNFESEAGWKFAVPRPDKCAPGLIPYPLIIHGPKTQGTSMDGMSHEYNIILQRATTEKCEMEPKDTGPKLVRQYRAVEGKGLGPIESGELVLDNLEVENPGRYLLKTSYYVRLPSMSRPTRSIVIESEPFDVEVSYDNSKIQLDDGQINLIKQAMNVNDELKKLYGDFITRIETNSK